MKTFMRNSKKRRRVLVVDDEIINRELLETILSLNYDVETASDGQEALNILNKNKNSRFPFSLILMDLLMPNMSGFRLLEARMEDEVLRDIPAIVMTSEKSAEVRSIKMGADDFISKPYRMPEVILARCERIIELSEEKRMVRSIQMDHVTGLYTRVFFDAYIRRDMPDFAKPADALAVTVGTTSGRQINDDDLRAVSEVLKEAFTERTSISCYDGNAVFLVLSKHRSDFEQFADQLRQRFGGTDLTVTTGVYQNVDRDADYNQWFERARAVCGSAAKGTLVYA